MLPDFGWLYISFVSFLIKVLKNKENIIFEEWAMTETLFNPVSLVSRDDYDKPTFRDWAPF